jgi:hypothetical protein
MLCDMIISGPSSHVVDTGWICPTNFARPIHPLFSDYIVLRCYSISRVAPTNHRTDPSRPAPSH